MALTIREVSTQLTKVKEEFTTQKRPLTENVRDKNKLPQILAGSDSQKKDLEKEITAFKKKKFKRNMEDYRRSTVYRWRMSNADQPEAASAVMWPWRHITRNNTDKRSGLISSTHSSSSLYSDSTSFTSDSANSFFRNGQWAPHTKKCRRGKKSPTKKPVQDPPEESVLNVYNLSSKPISHTCITAISKGLSFVPTTQCNKFNTVTDMQKFFLNSLTLSLCPLPPGRRWTPTIPPEMIETSPLPTQYQLQEQLHPSDVNPRSFHPKHRNPSLDTYCRLVERDISMILNKKREN